MSTKRIILPFATMVLLVIGSGCDQPAPSDKLTELKGTHWTVEGIPKRVTASMAFGKDGRLTGFSGCNRFFANYTADGATLNIKGIGSTKKLCPDVEMSVEQELLKSLEIVKQWQGNANQIMLTAPVKQTKIKLVRDKNAEQ